MDIVAIYLRKSRDEENLGLGILQRHEAQLLDYCKRNGLFVKDIYKEVVSGDSIDGRPQMQLLLSEVEKGTYDGVVCMEIERLSRGNPVDQFEILETFKGSKTKIYTLNKVYDLSNEEIDEEVFEFALFMSRREYKVIKRRLLRGRYQSQKEGYFIGTAIPFGYDKEKQGRGFVLVPNKDAETVKLIFAKILEGLSTRETANYLNSLGLKPHTSNIWYDALVRKVVKNETYTGKIYAKQQTITYPGKHKALIDDETFAAANSLIKTKPRAKKDFPLLNPLAGLVVCSSCGHVMSRQNNSAGVDYLICRYEKIKSARIEVVESRLMDELTKELQSFNYYAERSDLKDTGKRHDKELSRLKAELKKNNEQLDKACDLLETGVYSVDLYKKRTQAINEKIDNINKNIDAITQETEKNTEALQAIPVLQDALAKYYTLSPENKNKLLKAIVKRIVYAPTDDGFDLDVTLLF